MISRTAIFRLSMLLIGMVIGLLIAECGVRVAGRDPLHSILQDPRTDRSFRGCFQLDSQLGYGYRPGQCEANSLGFPDREPVTSARRVLVLGDSIAADRLFADFLEPMLSADVVNTGVPGYSTINELGVYEKWAERLKPDAVVLQFCLNDYIGTPLLFEHGGEVIRVINRETTRWGRSARLFSVSALYRYLSAHTETARHPNPVEHFDAIDAALMQLRDAVAADGAALVVALFPPLSKEWSPSTRLAHARVQATLTAAGVPFIDLSIPFFSADIEDFRMHRGPDVHAELPRYAAQYGLPEHATDFLTGWPKKRMMITRLRPGNEHDTTHPNFLGHYIAADALARHLQSQW